MHIGLVGLGKMGNNMRARLRNAGIEVTGYDANPAVSDVADLGALAQALPSPRLVWVMVPHGQITDAVIKDLGEVLEPGDLVIDGGNSKWLDDEVHATLLDAKGIPADEQVLVAGDMNVDSHTSEYASMLADGGLVGADARTGHTYSFDTQDNSIARDRSHRR